MLCLHLLLPCLYRPNFLQQQYKEIKACINSRHILPNSLSYVRSDCSFLSFLSFLFSSYFFKLALYKSSPLLICSLTEKRPYIGCKFINFSTKKLGLKQYRVPFEFWLYSVIVCQLFQNLGVYIL